MKLAAMQPYLFPYLAYWKLLYAVDKFVVLDDVNYINKGWINRNRILLKGSDYLFTVPIKEASQNKKIKELELDNNSRWKNKFIKTLETAYKKAPHYGAVIELLNRCLEFNCTNLSVFITNSIKEISSYLEIRTQIEETSEVYQTDRFKKDQKIISICLIEGAKEYVNPIGGVELYDKQNFAANDIQLSFLHSLPCIYTQYGNNFIPDLSIIDIMMFNSRQQIMSSLNDYNLV